MGAFNGFLTRQDGKNRGKPCRPSRSNFFEPIWRLEDFWWLLKEEIYPGQLKLGIVIASNKSSALSPNK
jgi:hypothetical protein